MMPEKRETFKSDQEVTVEGRSGEGDRNPLELGGAAGGAHGERMIRSGKGRSVTAILPEDGRKTI